MRTMKTINETFTDEEIEQLKEI